MDCKSLALSLRVIICNTLEACNHQSYGQNICLGACMAESISRVWLSRFRVYGWVAFACTAESQSACMAESLFACTAEARTILEAFDDPYSFHSFHFRRSLGFLASRLLWWLLGFSACPVASRLAWWLLRFSASRLAWWPLGFSASRLVRWFLGFSASRLLVEFLGPFYPYIEISKPC